MSGRARPGVHADEAIAAIDVGLQTAGDVSYGVSVPDGRWCWRCLDREADPESTAGICAPCREVLLADPAPDEPSPSRRGNGGSSGPSVTERSVRLWFDGQEIPVHSVRVVAGLPTGDQRDDVIVASGGWCVPGDPLYDFLPVLGERGRTRWYDRLGLPISLDEAATLLADPDYKTVAFELVGNAIVSTMWLGHDLRLGPGPPRIFETMVFGGQLEGEQRRYSTQECAVIGHREMVQLVRAAREIP